MNWLLNIFDTIKWKIEDVGWYIKDKINLAKELKQSEKDLDLDNFKEKKVWTKSKIGKKYIKKNK